MVEYTRKEVIVVRVKGTDMEIAGAALRQKLADYPNARVTALTQRSSSVWDWSSSIQLLAAIEYSE